MIRENDAILCPCHKQLVRTIKGKHFCTVEPGKRLLNTIRARVTINLPELPNNHEDFKKRASGE